MLPNLSLHHWFGILALSCFIVTLALGIAMHKFGKNVFKYHMIFAFLGLIFALAHLILIIG